MMTSVSSPDDAKDAKGRLATTLRTANLSERIADAIVDSIASGVLKPGQRLIDAEIASDLAVSRLPVREAFKTLATQGIIELTLHRGARIAEIGDDRIACVLAVRTAVEQAAFAKAAGVLKAHGDPKALRDLDTIIESMKRAEERSDLQALNLLDIAFHRTIVAAARDPFLLALWEALALHLRIVFTRETKLLPRPIPYASVHLAIRYAIVESSEDELGMLLARHIAGKSEIDPPRAWNADRKSKTNRRRKT